MLQMKEATESVLERFVGHSPYATHGERVVQGQKLIQSTADVLLGWAKFSEGNAKRRDYYVRQLWNGKGIDRYRSSQRIHLERSVPYVRSMPGACPCTHRR